MDLTLTTPTGKLEVSVEETQNTVINNIALSLTIPYGGWWFNPKFGSKLHLLHRAKATASTAKLVQDYVKEALAWMVSSGRLTEEPVVETEILSGRINYRVLAIQADGQKLTYSNFVEVA